MNTNPSDRGQPPWLILGDDISTDDIIPANRCTTADPKFLREYALEHVIGQGKLKAYSFIEAGYNFGCGSSREHAPIALKAAGIRKIRARSFAEIFYRNSINIGLEIEIMGQAGSDAVTQPITAAGGLIAFNQKRRQCAISVPRSQTTARPMTMAEKILARASGNAYVRPGEIVFAKVDLAMSHDAVAGPVAKVFYQHFGAETKVWDPQRVVLVADHFIQVNDIRQDARSTTLHQAMIDFAAQQGCHLLDVVSPGEAAGICHVLLPEKGFIRPGMTIAGTDSHSCTYGAFGCFSTGVGTTDMANIFAVGDMWVRVPATLLFELTGILSADVCAKDIMLFILKQIGCCGAIAKVLEFRGPIIEQLPIEERMTLSNMAIECGAMCGLIAPDEVTQQYLVSRTQADFEVTEGDADANYEAIYRFDLTDLVPQVARPPKPDQVVGIDELEPVTINRAFIGSCTGGKLFDLAAAAAVLQGRQVAPEVDLYIVPASQEVRQQAAQLGYLDIFAAAGAHVLKSGCGACINAGMGILDRNEVGIYATNRNFKGRSGDATAQNYLASPRTVAIAAVAGMIQPSLDEGEKLE